MGCFEERLDREKHFVKVGDFQCGADDPLDIFLTDHRRNISVPVIEIARIAVDYFFQGKGLGKKLFYDFILPRIKKVEELIAVRKTVDESFNEACDLYVWSLVN